MFAELAFVDVGVERKVVVITKERGYFAYRESQFEEILDALQIGTLRFLGVFLVDPVNIPIGVITYVATQLSIADPQCIVRYAERIQTQQEHTLEIRKYCGYKEFSHRCGGFALMRFLYARIWIGTERPGVLFDLATAWLLDKKVLLPGVTTLTRLISTIRERVAERSIARWVSSRVRVYSRRGLCQAGRWRLSSFLPIWNATVNDPFPLQIRRG